MMLSCFLSSSSFAFIEIDCFDPKIFRKKVSLLSNPAFFPALMSLTVFSYWFVLKCKKARSNMKTVNIDPMHTR